MIFWKKKPNPQTKPKKTQNPTHQTPKKSTTKKPPHPPKKAQTQPPSLSPQKNPNQTTKRTKPKLSQPQNQPNYLLIFLACQAPLSAHSITQGYFFCHVPSFDLQHTWKGRQVQKQLLPSRPGAGECTCWWLSSCYLATLTLCSQQEIRLCLGACASLQGGL